MRQPLLKQQPILRLSGTQGTERTHTVPSTLTKIILVLLTMILLPSAAWGQDPISYGLTVAGTPVTSANADNVLGNDFKSVSYDPTSSTLTLKGAHLDNKVISVGEDIEELIVHLVGYNWLGTSTSVFEKAATTKLTFTTSTTFPGSLHLSSALPGDNIFYENGLSYNDGDKVIEKNLDNTTVTPFTGYVGYVDNQGENAFIYSGNPDFFASYATAPIARSVLVSPKGTNTYLSMWSTSFSDINLINKIMVQFDWGTCTNTDVTVQVRGMKYDEQIYNNVYDGNTYSDAIFLSTADADGIVEIPLTKNITSDYFELYFSSNAGFSFYPLNFAFISTETYNITVAGIHVSELNAANITGSSITSGKVSFNATSNTLTLDNAQVNGTISSAIADLKVHLIGSSVFTVDTEDTYAYWYNYTGADLSPNTPALTFSVESIGASLTLNATSSEYGHSVDIAPSDYSVVNTDADWTSWNKVTSGKYSGGVWFCKVSKPYLWVAGGEIDDSNKDNSAENHGFNGTNTVTLSGITPGNLSYDRAYARDNLIKSNIANLTVNVSGVNSLWMDSEEQTISSRLFSYTGASGSSSSLNLVMEEDASIEAMWKDDVTASLDYLIEGFAENNIETDLSEIQIGESGIFAQADENIITISNVEKYNLKVNGFSVNSLNKDNIFEEDTDSPTASFKDGVLTLKGAAITTSGENAIESGLASLEINLIGKTNTITCQGNSDIAFKGLSSGAKVTFTTDTESPGELTVAVLQANTFKDITPDYQNGLSSTRNGDYFTIGVINYGLTIAGVSVTSANCDDILKDDSDNTGKVSFKPADDNSPATLTLNNANIRSSSTNAIETELSTLNIDLKGNNFITATGGFALSGKGSTGSYTINFTSSSDPVGNLTLKASGYLATTSVDILYDTNTGLVPTIISPSSATNLAGAYDAIIAKGTALGLTVAGVLVTNSNATDIKGDGIAKGKVSYDETHKTLTLNKAEINGPIESSIEELTVYLIGENTINVSSDRPFIYTGFESSSATLTFDSSNSDEGGLTMTSQYIVDVYEVSNEVESDDYSNLWAMTQNSSTGETYIYYNVQYGINVGDYCVSKENKNNITNESSSEVLTYSPEDNILNLPLALSSTSVISHRKELILQVSGSTALKSINFVKDADFYDGTGTLTITGDSDYDGVNSLSLGNNSSGVITGFSSVDLTLPMHVSSPENFTGWTASVTSATITDETWDLSSEFEHGLSYVTFCYPYEDVYIPSTITPYVITGISGSSVTTQALSYIPKGVPVLLSKTNNTATTATFNKNELKYAESSENPVTASEGKALYVLYNNEFVKVTSGTNIYGCYMDLTGVNLPANTRGLSIDGNAGTSAIDATIFEELNTEGDAWYDLQGRRIAKPTKAGLYIINGKKVVLK